MSRRVLALAILLFAVAVGRAEDPITVENLEVLVAAGTDEREILQLIRRAGSLDVTREGIARLKKVGASEAILEALRARLAAPPEFGLDDVLAMLGEKRPNDEILDAIVSEGLQLQLSARDKLRLAQAGASAAIIKALQGGYVYPGFARYLPDHWLFAMQHPEGWRASSWYTAEGFKVVLSPDRVPAPNKFTTGVQVQVYRLEPRALALRVGVHEAWLRKYDSFVRLNQQYELQPVPGVLGVPLKTTLGGNEAVRQHFFVTMQGKACQEIMVESVDGDLLYFIEAVAPREEFAKYAPVFRRMLRTFQPSPGQRRISRRAAPIDANELIERYRESVVHVRSHFEKGLGFGTGFFVREDGYVLTNHHVVCSKRSHRGCTHKGAMELGKKFEVVWDATVGPKQSGQKHRVATARLVSTVHLLRPRVDLALLKVEPDGKPFRAMPISRVGREKPTGAVREGDPVLALGFPLPTRLGIGRLTSTTGDLANLQYSGSSFAGATGGEELDYLLTRLVINKGNSGGPLIDRVSGAVIGLNTWVELATEGQSRLTGERLGYSSATAIDYAYEYFPQLRFYPRGRELPPEAHVELATMFVTRENLVGAEAEFEAALARRDRLTTGQRANLYYQLFRFYDKKRRPEPARTMLDACLKEKPDHADALVSLAYRVPQSRIDQAIGYIEKSIAARPDDWWGLYYRADFYRRAGRHDDALAELKKAEASFGAGDQAALHKLRGRVLFEAERYDDGRASYERALAIEPEDLDTRLALADYYARKKNTSGALMEYARVLQDHGDEPLAHERYGRFLRTVPSRRAEGLASMTRAATLALNQRAAPSPSLLRDLASAMGADPKLRHEARAAALLLYQYWPGWRGTAHRRLSSIWKQDGRPGIAYGHDRAAADAGAPLLAVRPAATPLTTAETIVLMRARYPIDVFTDVVSGTNLAFPIDKPTAQSLVKSGVPAALLPQLTLRSLLDQVKGGPSLASLVKIEFVGKVQTGSKAGPYSTVKFTNTGKVPLTGFQLRYAYKDENQKEMFASTHPFRLRSGRLMPGRTQQVRLSWHDWNTLKKKVGDTKKIKWYSLRAEHARNADYLGQMAVRGGFTKDKKAYRFTIENHSVFNVRNIRVRCEFLDTQGRPIRAASGSRRGLPVDETVSTGDVTLAPKQKSGELTVKNWADWNHFAHLGISRAAHKTVRTRVSVVDADVFFPQTGQ